MWAALEGHEGMVQKLIDCGAEASPAPRGAAEEGMGQTARGSWEGELRAAAPHPAPQ